MSLDWDFIGRHMIILLPIGLFVIVLIDWIWGEKP